MQTVESQHETTYPLEQETDKREVLPSDEGLSKFLCRISDNIENLDKEKRLSLFRKQIKAHQYYDGNFYGYVDENCEWQTRRKEDNETWYSDNQYYPYLRTALMELNRRQTEVQINAAYEDERLEGVAKFAQKRYNENRDRTFNAHLKQTENTYALLNGIVFRYTYFDFSGRKEKLPRMRKQKGESKEDSYLCAGCSSKVAPLNMDGNQSDTPCSRCGSTFVQIISPDNEEIIIGYEELPTGKNVWVSPNPIGIIISMQASTLEESPFLKWKQLILRSVLEHKFKNFTLPSTGTISTELRYIGNQQTATPATGNGDFYSDSSKAEEGGQELELLEFQQHWLDYPVYCKVKFDKAQKLANGKVLKAGESLGSLFPDGLYFARVGDLIVDIWNEDKNSKWVSSPYSLRAGSCYGAGTFPAHADQELINDFKALSMANAWNNGVLREFVNPDYITELSADPAIPTEFRTVDDKQLQGYGYFQASPAPLSPEIYSLEETAKGSMQNKVGAMSNAGGGLADSQKWGDTATAISIKREMAVGRFAPDLELMADNLDRKQAYQFLENEKRFFTPSQWQKVKGDYNADAVRDFLQCDIKNDLTITIVPGSYMPKSDSQILSRVTGYAQIAPALMQMGNEELMNHAAEVFGIPQHLAGWTADKEAVGRLIERFEALSEKFVSQYGDAPDSDLSNPNILGVAEQLNAYSKIPVDVWLDNHAAIIDALKDWRVTDSGRDASNVLLAAVSLRIIKHREALVKQKQMDAADLLKAQEPLEAKQKEQQAEQLLLQEGMNEDAAVDEENQAELMIADTLNQKDEAEKDRELQENQTVAQIVNDELQREHELQIQQMENQNQG